MGVQSRSFLKACPELPAVCSVGWRGCALGCGSPAFLQRHSQHGWCLRRQAAASSSRRRGRKRHTPETRAPCNSEPHTQLVQMYFFTRRATPLDQMNTRRMQRLVRASSLTWQWGERLHFCWCNWPRHWRTGWSTARRAPLVWSWNREVRHTTAAWGLAVTQSRRRQGREPDGRRTGAGGCGVQDCNVLGRRLRPSGAGQICILCDSQFPHSLTTDSNELTRARAVVLNLYGTRDPFHGRQFFCGLEWGMVSGWSKLITFIAHFISTIITLVPPRIIRH